MKHSVIVKFALIFSHGLSSFTFAGNDKHCDISFESYVNPSIAGSIFSAKNKRVVVRTFRQKFGTLTRFSAVGMGNDRGINIWK